MCGVNAIFALDLLFAIVFVGVLAAICRSRVLL